MKTTESRFQVFKQFLADYYGASLVRADGERLISPELWQDWPTLQAAIDNQAYAIFRSERSDYYAKALGLL